MADHGPTRGRDLKSEKRQERDLPCGSQRCWETNLANAFR